MEELGTVLAGFIAAFVVLSSTLGVVSMLDYRNGLGECQREHNVYKCERVYVPVEEER